MTPYVPSGDLCLSSCLTGAGFCQNANRFAFSKENGDPASNGRRRNILRSRITTSDSMPARMAVDPPPDRRLRPLHVFAGLAALLAILWFSIWFLVQEGKRAALTNVDRNNSNLAVGVAQHAEVTLNQADRLALVLRELWQEPVQFARQSASMKEMVRGSEAMLQAAIAVADGTVVWTTVDGPAANISDREHFRVHVDRDLGRPFVSKPVLGRVSGNWSVQVTRRLNDPHGGFAGVVVLSLDPFYFTRRFARLQIGDSGRVALVGTDGVVRARTTGTQKESAGDVIADTQALQLLRTRARGRLAIVSGWDGIERLDVFSAVGDYDLRALVGVSRDEALRDFHDSRRNYLVFGALVSMLLATMSVLIVVGLRRQLALLAEAEQARLRAERSNARKTEFVGAIAHEVRTPLSSIIGYSQLIAAGKVDPVRHAAFARQVEAAGLRVSETMNDLLEIARIEANKLVFTYSRVSLRELVGDCVDVLEPKARAKGLLLKAEFADDVPDALQTDRARVQQVLTHLVDNAIRHAGEGEVDIRVTRDGDKFRIVVADQGQGIPADVLDSLFNRFEGDMSPVALRISGTGLGLSIVKAVVERMGGRVRAEVLPNVGTRIEVVLPFPLPD